MKSAITFPSFGLRRRSMLAAALSAGALHWLPSTQAAAPEAAPSFMALSSYLTERTNLDTAIGARLLVALNELDAAMGAKLDALWQWIHSSNVPLAQLNDRLKAEKPEWVGLAQQVMQVWYQGIAGEGVKTRVVTYEYALNAQVVADKLRPPSYVYGGYGSWSANPTTFDLKLNVLQR